MKRNGTKIDFNGDDNVILFKSSDLDNLKDQSNIVSINLFINEIYFNDAYFELDDDNTLYLTYLSNIGNAEFGFIDLGNITELKIDLFVEYNKESGKVKYECDLEKDDILDNILDDVSNYITKTGQLNLLNYEVKLYAK